MLTGVIYDNCPGCLVFLHKAIRFPFSSFNYFGYSFLGMALRLGRH
jgi:hypothetical protein